MAAVYSYFEKERKKECFITVNSRLKWCYLVKKSNKHPWENDDFHQGMFAIRLCFQIVRFFIFAKL